MADWHFIIDTYGCKINQYETSKIKEAWLLKGGKETKDPQQANFILINSCAITTHAERDARNAINRYRQLAPDAKIILSGCAAQFYHNFKPYKNIAFILPDYCISQKDKYILLEGPPDATVNNKPVLSQAEQTRTRPVVKIQDGCTQNCAYCIVPQTRGRSVSRSRDDILKECQKLLRSGYQELIISGINLRQYHAEGNFWSLVKFLDANLKNEIDLQPRLRISSIDPALLTDEGLETIISSTLLCPHLHLSIQHASKNVLTSMKRNHYTPEKIINAVKMLKYKWPVMGLGADFITGFPGETQEDFKKLLYFTSELPLTYAHVFPYSQRPGTAASTMAGQIPYRKKAERAKILRETIEKRKIMFWQEQTVLESMKIILEKNAKNSSEFFHGLNEYYVPCFLKKSETASSGLIAVKPVKLLKKGIEVELTGNK